VAERVRTCQLVRPLQRLDPLNTQLMIGTHDENPSAKSATCNKDARAVLNCFGILNYENFGIVGALETPVGGQKS
jgi:hypothetical protein